MPEQEIFSSSIIASPVASPSVVNLAEDILGCKWSLQVLQLIRQGIGPVPWNGAWKA